MKQIAVVFLTILVGATLGSKYYSGYQVLRTPPLSTDDVAKVLGDSRFRLFGKALVALPVLIMTSPEHVVALRSLFAGAELEVFIADLGAFFANQTAENEKQKQHESNGLRGNVTFNRFMELDEIDAYLDEVVSTFPELASLEEIGTSYEGRRMRVLKVSRGGAVPRPGVFVEAGIHAAEWLGPPVALYTIFQLTAHVQANHEMLDLADWYILPVANPDGYVFSWTDDRLWRKSRKPNAGSECIGVDLNRNFDIHWGGGNVTDPCAWNYAGASVYSDPESRAVADFIRTKDLTLFMALHTYGQYLLYPYGYSSDLPSDNVISAAAEAVLAVKEVRGTVYTPGSITNLFHMAYGSSVDYAYEVAKVALAYVWELPAGDQVKLAPPPSDIRPVCEEIWRGFKTLVRRAAATK